jgi:hypothetical protein
MYPKKLAAYVLGICAGLMIYLGIAHGMLPPLVTGIGFTAIAWVFWKEGQGN